MRLFPWYVRPLLLLFLVAYRVLSWLFRSKRCDVCFGASGVMCV